MNDQQRLYRAVGQALRTAREEAGWTQAESAAAIGLSRQAMNMIENGRMAIMLPHLVNLARCYGLSPRLLLPRK